MTHVRCGAPDCANEIEFDGLTPPAPWIFVVAAIFAYVVVLLPTWLRNFMAYVAIGVAVALYLLPIYWIGITSITPSTAIGAVPPKTVV